MGTVVSVASYVVRVWLPDRPGALGQVASRIGAVRGDVVGIEILEQGAGRAVDELVVVLPDASVVDVLAKEINEVDGVDVEDIRQVGSRAHDHGMSALDAGARIAEAPDPTSAVAVLCEAATADLEGDWGAVVDLAAAELLAAVGEPPDPGWIAAFVNGSRHSEALVEAASGPDDLAYAELPALGAALVVARQGRPLRWRERRSLVALARLTNAVAARRG